MENLLQDIRYALRKLRKSPGFAVVAVLALSLGVGANTSIFSIVKAILLRPLPFKEPERLVILWNEYKKNNLRASNSVPDYYDRRERSTTLEDVSAFTFSFLNLTGKGEPVRVLGAPVTASFFAVLGVQPFMGRAFTPEEDQPGRNRVAVLGYGCWQRRFGGDPNIVGKTINLDGQNRTVIGVMPESFNLALVNVEVFTPIAFTSQQRDDSNRGFEYLTVLARLKSRIQLAQVQAEMESIAASVPQRFPDRRQFLINEGWTASVVPLRDQLFGDVRPVLSILLGAVGLVLLIACANVANLLLARAAAREREIAVRAALGARRGRLVRQLLTESVLLALLGGALGLGLAFAGVRAIVGAVAALAPVEIPIVDDIRVDAAVLAFTLTLSMVTGIIFGLVPAFDSSRVDVNESLKEGGKTSGFGGRHRLQGFLVVSQVAIALVLLFSAGLMLRSVRQLMQVNPGFRTENRLTFSIALPEAKYGEAHQKASFFKELLSRIRSLPGVRAAGCSHIIPLAIGNNTRSFSVDGYQAAQGESTPLCEYRVISPGFIQAMGIPLLKGRDFNEGDDDKGKKVLIVDEKTAQRFWRDVEPIGRRIRFGDGSGWLEVIGVVGSVKNTGLDAKGREQIYVPFAQDPHQVAFLAVHAGAAPLGLMSAVRSEVRALDSNLPISDIMTMDQRLEGSVAFRRYPMLLLLVFASVALVLAGVAIYGVISYSVSQRTREIGIRMALGASQGGILRMVIRQGMTLVLGGVAIGLGASLAVGKLLSSLLFGINPSDPITIVGISLLLAAVAFLACYVPARRATDINPMAALRYE